MAIDPESGRNVGVARYVRDTKRRDSAEVAFAVLEAWQGRGVGKALMHGLAELGPIRILSRDAGAVELAVELDPGSP